MSGDWIKMEMETLGKPEVVKMAELLGTTRYDVVGRLFHVWGWFDRQSADGNAGSVTGNTLKRFIDELVGSQGFAASMASVGWLTDEGMPNFDYHNGESAKKRALTAKRVKRSRNAGNVTSALPEKRREEKRSTPIVPARFDEFWNTYPGPRKVGKSQCAKVWIERGLTEVAEQIILHVAAMALTPQWREADGKYIPAPLTYLNQRRFEDGLPAAPARKLVV